MPKETISEATEAQLLARDLIPQHHKHLNNARLIYLFTDKKRAKAGKTILGTAKTLPAVMRYLTRKDRSDPETEAHFILLFGFWEWQRLTPEQRKALVDHELCHCGFGIDKDGRLTPKLIPHDVEEFTCIVQRYGLWKTDVREFGVAVQQHAQLSLPLEV